MRDCWEITNDVKIGFYLLAFAKTDWNCFKQGHSLKNFVMILNDWIMIASLNEFIKRPHLRIAEVETTCPLSNVKCFFIHL